MKNNKEWETPHISSRKPAGMAIWSTSMIEKIEVLAEKEWYVRWMKDNPKFEP